MIVCDLCDQAKECSSRLIENREYDICAQCWEALAERLKGKGREKSSEIVCLPPPTPIPALKDEPEQPPNLPKVFGVALNFENEPARQ
jgi:hypothetical protein